MMDATVRESFASIIIILLLFCFNRVKGMYDGQVRPKTGAPGIFPTHLEADLALFIKHCDLLRIPRTRKDLKSDIWHYVKHNDLEFKKLTKDGPGRCFIKLF